MRALRFNAHVLYLCAGPEKVRAQLRGKRLARVEALPLRDDISTDEITPLPVMVHFDETLGRFPHVGFKAGSELPIGKDAVRKADSPASSNRMPKPRVFSGSGAGSMP